jgi:haloalkane dehalogenase
MSKPIEIEIRNAPVLGSSMAYRETGAQDAPVVLFLHGNPTSSHIWRNILPLVSPVAHCIAPDLIGLGQSGKPDIAYRFFDHVRYLDAFIEQRGITSAYLVAQDWGTALAFHLAARRPDFVRGLAFMEFIRPMPTWQDFHHTEVAEEQDHAEAARAVFRKFRTPGEGEAMILEANAFVERVLPGGIVRKLSDEEMAPYRAPFPTPESRRPVLAFPRELPIAGEPSYPKLLFTGEPGALVSPEFAGRFAASLTHCALIRLGAGLHYLQEDHADAIGRSVAGWIAGIEAVRPQLAA